MRDGHSGVIISGNALTYITKLILQNISTMGKFRGTLSSTVFRLVYVMVITVFYVTKNCL